MSYMGDDIEGVPALSLRRWRDLSTGLGACNTPAARD